MNLAYFAADTLGVTLYQVKAQLIADEVHPIHVGPWNVDLPFKVESDIMSGTEVSFWMTAGKVLNLYGVVREKENWLFVLNTSALQACEAQTRFEADTVKDRILELKPAIRAVFRWKNDEWQQMKYDGGGKPTGGVDAGEKPDGTEVWPSDGAQQSGVQ